MNERKEGRDGMTEPRIDTGIDFATYAMLPGINASAIVAGQTSMKHMHYEMTREHDKPTPAMRWGSIVHAAVLEPVRFVETATVWTGKTKRGAEWDNFQADAPDPELIVKQDEYDKALRMAEIVNSHPEARHILNDAECECVLTWDGEKYGKARARADIINPITHPPTIADYKTTRSIEPRAFWRAAYNLSYHVRMGWYAHGYEIATGKRPAIMMIVQESDEPFDCWVCRMGAEIVRDGEAAAVEIAERYHACALTGHFAGVVGNEVIDYELPPWAMDKEINMEGITTDE